MLEHLIVMVRPHARMRLLAASASLQQERVAILSPAITMVVPGHLIPTQIPHGVKAISPAAFAPQLLTPAVRRKAVMLGGVEVL